MSEAKYTRKLKPHRSSLIRKFATGEGVVVDDPSKIPDLNLSIKHGKTDKETEKHGIDSSSSTSSFWRKLELNSLYRRLLFNRFKGDKAKLTMFTIVVMLFSEIPIYIFTLLDILKLKALFKYRLHYIQDLTEHLGIRNYPPNSVTLKTAKNALFNFYFAYLIPAALIMKLGTKLGVYIYDTGAEPEISTGEGNDNDIEVIDDAQESEKKVENKNDKLTWTRFIKEFVILAILADFGFYGVHRALHTKLMYKDFHKKHHEFKYAIALSHHWMEYWEAVFFGIPQVLPPIFYLLVTGKRMHVTSMWAGIFFSQLNSILGHAGYRMPIPRWFPCFQADFHDFHHVDYSVNYGAIFPFIDKLFGTYYHPGIETNMEKVMKNVKANKYM